MNIKNRLYKALLILSFTLVIVAASGYALKAQAVVHTGSYSSGPQSYYTYTLDTITGVLKIEGKGPLSYRQGGFLSVGRDDVKSIIIGEGITVVGNSNFMGFYNVVSVRLPSTIIEIQEQAFQGCDKLTTVNFPNGLTTIGQMAFNGCAALKSITLPNSLKTMGYGTFQYCRSLTSVVIPDSMTSLGNAAFSCCDKLKSVVVGKGIQVLPTGVFGACVSLTSVTLPETLKSIDFSAFLECAALTAIKIPASVTTIHERAFDKCYNLSAFTVAPGSCFKAIDGILYDSTGTQLLSCPQGKTASVVPEGVTSLTDGAFNGCIKLTSVKLPKSLKALSNNFSDCDALVTVDFGGVETINRSFVWPKALKTLTIPGTVKIISASFQECPALNNVILKEGVEALYGSFNSIALNSVSLPQSLKSIGSSFTQCGLTSVYIPGTVSSVDNSFNGCGSLSELFIGRGVQTITRSFSDCDYLTTLTLPASITDITASFIDCSGLNDVFFEGAVPKMLTAAYQPTSFGHIVTLFYLEGSSGWTSPTFNRYRSAVWAVPQETLAHFSTEKEPYYIGMFSDISENTWYGESGQGIVGTAVRLGIMSGTGDGHFTPNGMMTISQAVKMASAVHSIYYGGSGYLNVGDPWYQVWIDYALANGIIKDGDYDDVNAVATRTDLAYIFSNAVPAGALPAINSVTGLPDVSMTDKHAEDVFLLYNAGVLRGGDAAGSFYPSRSITRVEAAAIISRIALPEKRVTWSIEAAL